MLYAPEFQQVVERYGAEIHDLQTIARMHGMPAGAPEDLQSLPLRLAQDTRLRSDLSELVRALQAKDPELALPDVLSIVLAAIGGSALLDRRRDLEEPVDLLGGFLASLGGWPGSAVEPMTDIDNPPDHDPRLDLAASAYTETLEADLAKPAADQEPAFAPSIQPDAELADASNGTVTLAEITHALARLERGNLELRLHLDSIDQRICRMEPLLEAAPHPEPPHPEPPRPPLEPSGRHAPSSPLTAAAGDLIHRGSPSADPLSQQDFLDEVKARRRISLTSNFPDPPAMTSQPVVVAAAAPQGKTIAASDVPGSLVDPVSRSRVHAPRRDRFAAAREIPGNFADSDPLYTATDEELGAAALPQPVGLREPAPPATPSVAPETSFPAPPEAVVSPVVAHSSEEVADSSEEEVPRGTPAEASSIPAGAASISAEAEPRAPRYQQLTETTQEPALYPLFRGTAGTSARSLYEDPPVRTRTTTWITGIAAAAVLSAAGFLYFNGLPSALNEWVGGSSASVSSNTDPDSSPDPGVSQPAATNSTESIPARAGRSASSPQRASPTSPARVLGARESFNPSATVEKISGPTFVPGGIMDGYLVSAPRPVYPTVAGLVGAQGKVTFEAMVSRSGEVEAVKVLGGPQVLRSAATDAVKHWQYRPFEVKGQPVEVRTIIRVEVASKAGAAATE